MRDGRRQRHLRLRRRGHRNANANDRLATMTSPSVLDVMGSESSNDDKPVLDIRSTDPSPPWRGFPRYDISSVSLGQMVDRDSARSAGAQVENGCLVRLSPFRPCRLSRRKIEAMGPWPFCGVFIGDIGDWCAREKKKETWNIGISESVYF